MFTKKPLWDFLTLPCSFNDEIILEKETLLNPILWSPSEERIKSSQMFAFMQSINQKYKLDLDSFAKLHKWSIVNKADFWSSVWDFFQVIGSKGTEPYIYPENKIQLQDS